MKYIVIVLVVVSLFSCNKEFGCTTPEAINYNSTAEIEDNSCILRSKGIVYWDKPEVYFTSKNITHITVFLDDHVLVDNEDVSQYFNPPPGYVQCTDTVFWPKFDILYPQREAQLIKAYDQNNSLLYSRSGFALEACKRLEINFVW